VRAQRATERAIQIIFCFIGASDITIISYPVKKFIVLQRYRAVSYKVKAKSAPVFRGALFFR